MVQVGDSNSDSGYTGGAGRAGSAWLDSVSSGRGTGLDLGSEGSTNTAVTSPFSPQPPASEGSATPSLPDEGEFPCPQCDKRFGNRRNLMSHMRRHTGEWELGPGCGFSSPCDHVQEITNYSVRAVARDSSPSPSWIRTNGNTQVTSNTLRIRY